jgi:putative nucleotidyltransferase with HDIG domain
MEKTMITDEDIRTLFSSVLERIKNADLRDKVVQVWLLACERGGWTGVDELKNMPFTLLTNTHGISFIEHTLAVTEGAYGLAKAQEAAYGGKLPYKIDYDRLLAGGLLHDVGKLLETEPDGKGGYRKSRSGSCTRHPISGTALAYEVGLRDELLNTIACHAKEGEGAPKCLETILVHQADFATFDPLVMLEKATLIQ